jgi:DNA repair protein RecN (Recombination protein N)
MKIKHIIPILLTAAVSLVAFSCAKPEENNDKKDDGKKPEVVEGKITVSDDALSVGLAFAAQPEPIDLEFAATLDWTAKASENWLTITPASGKAGDKIKVTVNGNAEEIKENLYGAVQLFSGDEDRSSVDSMMKEAGKLLSRAGKYVPSAQTLSERLESLRYEMEDILSEAESLQEGVDVSADRLEAVEQRMSLIYDLQKKHGCSTVAELIAIKDALSETLFDSSSLEERRKTLQDDISSLNAKLSKISQELHSSRVKAAIPFGKKIESDIRSLELDKAVFDVQILPSQQSATGTDTVLLRFSSTGRGPVDVAKCASGGELSRIMLCLKAMMARYTNMPTMIFDEIDTGVSGSVADRMGRMICSMGEDMQVFAITHLPQVAANGNAHFLVRKEEKDGRTVSTISRIEGEDRVMEIARMLSGTTITPEAVQNARSLLSRAGR